MNILITGGTGFIGNKLGPDLLRDGHRLYVVTRDKFNKENPPYPAHFIEWNDLTNMVNSKKINFDSVINLAGEPITQRWNERVKREILNSRVDTTARLVRIFKDSTLKSFISGSAVGYYGDREDEILDEESESGTGFLARVCFEWERAALQIKLNSPNTRAVILRFGMVLGKDGGALKKMTPPFKHGVGGMIGDGKMWISWIQIDDLVNMIKWAIENPAARGIYNAVSPNPVTNRDFSTKLAGCFNKKLLFPIPRPVVKLALGEMSQVVLSSQRVDNSKVKEEGFGFKYSNLTSALVKSLS